MLKNLELDKEQHMVLVEHCQKRRIEFMSTPFDLDSVDFLANVVNVARLKLSSGDIYQCTHVIESCSNM